MNLEVGCGVEKSISKPNSLLYLMEWVVHGTGIVPTERQQKKERVIVFGYIILRMWLVYILLLFEFLSSYSIMQATYII